MTLLTRMAMLAMGATPLFMVPGCAQEPADFDDEDYEFRCQVLGGCGDDGGSGTGGGGGDITGPKGNTSFLGTILAEGGEQDAFKLNNLSLVGGAVDGVSITSIFAPNCIDRAGLLGPGISEANPTFEVDDMGRLLPKIFTKTTDPSTTCTVSAELWEGTVWSISYTGPEATFDTELRIDVLDTTSDLDGAPLYKISVNSDLVPDFRFGWNPVCGYDSEGPALAFKAFLIPGLRLDATDESFTSGPNEVFIGCISGSIGKAWHWGYKSFVQAIGTAGHEVAHNAIRAEYCNDNVSYTESGTPVWFQSIFTNEGPDPYSPTNTDWELEAVWSSDPTAPAICVGTTRRPEHQPQGNSPFSCPSAPSIPQCDETDLTNPSAVLASWAWTGT